MLDTIALALIVWAMFPATLFPILYGFTAPWWESHIGRALMTKAVGMALLIDLSVLYNFFGDDYPGRDYVRLVVFSLVTVGITYQCWVFIQVQFRGRMLLPRQRRPSDPDPRGATPDGERRP